MVGWVVILYCAKHSQSQQLISTMLKYERNSLPNITKTKTKQKCATILTLYYNAIQSAITPFLWIHWWRFLNAQYEIFIQLLPCHEIMYSALVKIQLFVSWINTKKDGLNIQTYSWRLFFFTHNTQNFIPITIPLISYLYNWKFAYTNYWIRDCGYFSFSLSLFVT